MTDLRDHAQKIERIAQALTAEGIGRDVAVSTALMRFPPTRTFGVDAELDALAAKGRPATDPASVGPSPSAFDPISELADCEPVHFTLMVVADRNQRTEMVSCTASQRGASADSLIYAGEIGKQEANTAVRFLRAQKPLEIIIGATARFGTLHRFDVTTRGPGTYVMEFKLADDRELATATSSVNAAGRPVVDYPVPQQPRLVSLKRAAALWQLLNDIESLDIIDFEDPVDYMKAVDYYAKKRDQYLSGGHLIVVSDQTREMTAEESADGLATATAVRDACMDAAARAQERDAAIDQRDTLIDREAKMRAVVLDAIGPVSTGSTLDLVQGLADLYKASKASYERVHEAHVKAVNVLESAAGLTRASHRSIVELAQRVATELVRVTEGREMVADVQRKLRMILEQALTPGKRDSDGAAILDLAAELAEKYKMIKADRESMLAELEAAKHDLAVMTIARGSAINTVRALEAKLEAVRGAAS